MTREEANLIVRQRVHYINDIKGVPLEIAKVILGTGGFIDMMNDKIRNKGPADGYVYPWNVEDYLIIGSQKPSKCPPTKRLSDGSREEIRAELKLIGGE